MDRDALEKELKEIKDKIMSTKQASIEWGLSADRIKTLCHDKVVVAIKLDEDDSKSPYLILRNQPNPKQRG
ncbi:hypothetical protein [Heyndrickxia ginsengihumi]|uniref:hypothetical protein n=1 Tax=Heyndrickxia ginsengihumi TaxID=363870 RepID=UPI00047120BC|nr:hypothetical protein [Heyndrickxia ginsengihumi]